MKRHIWSEHEIKVIISEYPTVCGKEIAKKLNLEHGQVLNKAFALGLKKDISFMRTAAKRLAETGKAHRFKKGCEPATKGKKQHEYMSPEAIERTKGTRFKKGQVPHNALPVGSEVVRVDKRSGKSYILTKIEGQKKLVYKQIHVWEQANNKKLPAGHNIVFKDGNTHNCEISNLECISNAELMLRNTITQYPTELQRDIKKLGKLKKIIKNLES